MQRAACPTLPGFQAVAVGQAQSVAVDSEDPSGSIENDDWPGVHPKVHPFTVPAHTTVADWHIITKQAIFSVQGFSQSGLYLGTRHAQLYLVERGRLGRG